MSKLRALHTALAVIVIPLAVVAVAHAATQGDQTPRARYGQTCTLLNDGGADLRVLLFPDAGSAQIPGANALIVTNPAGSLGTIYCGWDQNVNERNGTPVTQGSSLSVDITCPSGRNSANVDSCPSLRCAMASTSGNQFDDAGVACTRWMQVK